MQKQGQTQMQVQGQCTEFTTRNARCRRLATRDGRCAHHARSLRVSTLESLLAAACAERDALRERVAHAEDGLAAANVSVKKLVDVVHRETIEKERLQAEKDRLQAEKDELAAELQYLELGLDD